MLFIHTKINICHKFADERAIYLDKCKKKKEIIKMVINMVQEK